MMIVAYAELETRLKQYSEICAVHKFLNHVYPQRFRFLKLDNSFSMYRDIPRVHVGHAVTIQQYNKKISNVKKILPTFRCFQSTETKSKHRPYQYTGCIKKRQPPIILEFIFL